MLVNLTNNGKVGIGTNAPTSQLHLNGVQDALKITADQPIITLTDTTAAGSPRVELQNSQGRFFVASESFLNGTNSGGFTMVDAFGRLSIGNFNPAGPFEVWVSGGQPGLMVANNGNIGIGTATPIAKLDVNGSVHFSPSFRVMSLPGAAFIPDNLNAGLGSGGGFGYYSETGVEGYFGNFFAPVILPDGATVTRIDLTYVDSSNADFTLSLGRTSVTTGATSIISSQVSSGNSGAVRVQGVDTVGIATSNNLYAYWLKANLSSVGGSLHKIVAVRITYTITQP